MPSSVPFSRLAVCLCAIFLTSFTSGSDLPYVGSWSNGRGDTLVITARTMRFASDKPVPYRDLTKATDGKMFDLEITAEGEVNFFSEKFLRLNCGDDEMRMTGFKSMGDLLHDKNAGSDFTWYKDDESEAD